MWIDGKLIGDFPNMRLHDVQELKIDRFGIGLYIAENSSAKIGSGTTAWWLPRRISDR